jgi:hypothetical protein
MATENWREYLVRLVLGSTEKEWWGKFLVAIGVNSDLIDERLSQTLRAGWVHREQLPADTLRIVGADRNLQQYPAESNAQFQARCVRAWTDWGIAGNEAFLEAQLAAAGFAGAQVVYHTDRTGPRGEAAPYWSQFWISIPETSLTLEDPVWGRMIYGCFWWGVAAMRPDTALLFWWIVNKLKPVDHVCRGVELA